MARAGQRALIDAAYSDPELLEVCRGDLDAVAGEHTLEDLDVLEPLFGDTPREWAAMHWPTTRWGDRDKSATCRVEVRHSDVIRVISHGQDGPRRVVARAQVTIAIPRRIGGQYHHDFEAFWTLTRLDRGWVRTAVEGRWDGRRHLDHDPLVEPDTDVEYLHESAVLELADQSVAQQELIDATGDVIGHRRAYRAALDLSQIAGRYGLDVIESCVRRILSAWEAATNGQPHALDRLAVPHAASQLLTPHRGLPSAIREPALRKLELIEVDASADPPTITFQGTVRGHPYISHLDICWRLRLATDHPQPWILDDAMGWKDAYSYTRD